MLPSELVVMIRKSSNKEDLWFTSEIKCTEFISENKVDVSIENNTNLAI